MPSSGDCVALRLTYKRLSAHLNTYLKPPTMHLILTGATGTIGSATLHYALHAPEVTKLSILSRRAVPMADGYPKANVHIQTNYTEYPERLLSELRGAHGCIWAQGVSQNDVNKE